MILFMTHFVINNVILALRDGGYYLWQLVVTIIVLHPFNDTFYDIRFVIINVIFGHFDTIYDI